mgnify:CR=1 FL=1
MVDGKIVCLGFLAAILFLYFAIYFAYTRNNYFNEFKNKNEKKEILVNT